MKTLSVGELKAQDGDNGTFVSAVSLWEISLKVRIKKLDPGKIKPGKLLELIRKMELSTIELSPETSNRCWGWRL